MISRATGGVWIILTLVQNDRENKNKNIRVLAPPGLRLRLPFRDVPMTWI